MEFEPVSIVGVVTEEVGSPRNDGGPGSGLYRVPIQLSRPLGGDEADVFVRLWDRPPSWTTMHRPGIGRVSGDRFLLDGTTVDEVAQYHASTLRQVVQRFNDEMAAAHRRQAEQAQADVEAEEAHRRHVEDVSKDIRFD